MALSVNNFQDGGFMRFDVVSDPSDHHYCDTENGEGGGGDSFAEATSAVYKKIMREWKILSEHLPDSTYVRVYDTRIDLLRAVIVGAAGTPYHDGLFFFDIKFPPNYPDKPPEVHYLNHGLRLNPNLHRDGTVCLSLLNTWNGNETERWVPSQSTILQVVVSIQGLVLNERPFFNEPMRPRLFEEAESRLYNEYAFVNTCRMTLYLLQNPPKYFERFTADHFCQRARRILRACNAYANSRVGVGYYRDDKHDSAISGHQASNSFIHSMEHLYPKLVEAFKRNGALNLPEEHLNSVEEHLNSENGTTSLGCICCCFLLYYAFSLAVPGLVYWFQ